MPTNNLLVLKKTLFGLAIGWTVLIAFLCLITFSKLPSLSVSGVDKYVHVTFHFVFIMLWGLSLYIKQNEIRTPKIVFLVVLSILYGIVIEILQETITTTRHADILDVLANFIGAILGSLGLVLIIKTKNNQK